MKKLVYLILLFVNTVAFSQSNTITYQAVIYLPSGQNTPGVDVANQPMTNKNICLQFSFIDENNRVEYQEEIKVKTDEFGMVNLTIGNGAQSGGYASSFDAIIWNASVQKKLQVALDAKGLCNQFELLSNEPIASVPFANAAITAGNVSGVVALANGGTGATSAAGVRANLGLSNVENTSDLNKPMSTATKTYVDSRLTSSTIVDADATTKGKIQLTGDLAGTAASPSVPGLALKENAANKSATTTLGTSDVLFPTQKAVKTYVDTAIAGATIVDAAVNTKGKIQLAGDLAGTAAAPTVPGLALKENAANKSTTTTLGTSDVFFPTQNAVKTYVDTAISGATIVDADANTKGKIRLTGDLAGVANSPEVAAGAISTTKLADNAVTTAKLVNASVTNAKLDKANIPLSGFAAAVAEVNLGSNRLTNVTNPTSPQDAATKNYVDSSVSSGAPDADLTTKGKIQLTGDLTGSAGFPVIASNAVTSDKILDGTIVNADLSTTAAIAYSKLNLASSIAVGDLANNAVETNKIKDAAVTSDKILDGTIANADLSTTAAIAYSKLNLASSIVVGDLADNAVTTAKLANASVTNGKLDKTNIPLSGFGAAVAEVNLGSNKLINVTNPTAAQDAATKNYVDTATSGITTLADGKIYLGNASNEATEVTPTGDVTITNAGVTAIGSEKVVAGMLATDAVETAKIKNLNVTTGKLADGAVTTVKLSTDAVETAKIKDAAVTTAKILDGTILVDDLADAAVETAKIKDLNVTTGKLAASAVTYAKIQNVSATNKVLGRVSANAGVVEEIATTGSGDVVRATSPTLVTPTLGVATATSVAFSGATSGTATIAAPATAGTTTITLPGASGTLATLAGTETLTNKTLTSPILTTPTLGVATATSVGYSGSTSGTATIVAPAIAGTTTITLPGATGTLATLAGAETLTNKTLTSPALTTPALGVATATSINKVTITTPSTGATLTIANGKTLTANNSIVLAGTDDKTMTFPTTDATIARTDAAQTFTGVQTFSSDIVVNSVNIGRGNGAVATNTAVGKDAISATATGADNTALGYNTLKAITSGTGNTAVGSQAALAMTTGTNNTVFGSSALSTLTSSQSNTAIGNDALKLLGDSTNDRNTAVGTGSFANLTTGQYNVGLGMGSLLNATSGSNNVALGKYAGFRDTNNAGVSSSNQSIFIGSETKPLNATSTNEIVIGYDARGLGNNTTVIGNSSSTQAKLFGALNLPDATTSTTATTGALTVAGGAGIAENLNVGGNAKITGTLTVTSGAGNGKVLTSDANGLGTWTTPAGVTTMAAIGSTPNANGATISGVNLNLEPASATYGGVVTTGAQTFAGAKTFSPTLTAAANGETLVGLDINPTFTNGSYTGLTNYGLRVQGIGIGLGSGGITTNTAVGTGVLINNFNGSNNTGLGYLSLVANTSGIENTGIGTNSLNRTSTGSNNTAIGSNSGDKLTTGAKNIFVGSLAGSKIASSTTSNTTGANSVLIGYDVRPAADGETNEIVISGYNGTAGTVGKGSNTTSIGNAATTDTYIYGNLIVSGQVKLNSTSSVLVLSKTANYDIATTDNANLIIFKGSTASQTIKLPAASANIGREITIKNIATVSVSIASAGGYLISDSSTTTAATLAIGIEPSNNWIKAISDGTDWIIFRALF